MSFAVDGLRSFFERWILSRRSSPQTNAHRTDRLDSLQRAAETDFYEASREEANKLKMLQGTTPFSI